MTYEEDFEIEKSEFDRLQALLDITDLSEESEETLAQLGAKEDDFIPVCEIVFSNGAYLTLDICSGTTNYYDDAVIHTATRDYMFDPSFDIGTMIEFDTDTDEYIVNFVVI